MGGLKDLFLCLFVGSIQFLIASSHLQSATHYVSNSGSNLAPYSSWETATPRISFAAQYYLPGDTIRISSGTYIEPEEVLLNGGLAVIGEGSDSTEIRNTGTPAFQFSADSGDVSISDIRFTSQPGPPYVNALISQAYDDTLRVTDCRFEYYDMAIYSAAQYLDINNCFFFECASIAYEIIEVSIGSGNGTIRNCSFVNNRESYGQQTSIYMFFYTFGEGNFDVSNNLFYGYQESVYATLSPGLITIENNLFLNNITPSPNVDAPYLFLGTPRVIVRNNLFEGNQSYATGPLRTVSVDVRSYGTAEVYNNTFIGNQPGVRVRHDNGFAGNPPFLFTIDHNNFWLDRDQQHILFMDKNFDAFDSLSCEDYFNQTDTTISIVQNNLCRDPMFVDTIDYLLQAGSPLIDAGRPDIFDIDGTRSDIGPFGGPAGQFYSYQDFPSEAPQGLVGSANSSSATLQWLRNSESDLWYYVLFKSTTGISVLDSNHVLGYIKQGGDTLLRTAPDDSSFLSLNDSTFAPSVGARYTIVAVDSNGLISIPAAEVYFVGTDVNDDESSPLPQTFDLEQNYPNPFNATTAIVYSLPNIGAQPAEVKLIIYNSLGQLVRVLVDERQYSGRQVAYWNGLDNSGNAVASGIYFYKLQISGIDFIKSKKMILLK